MHIFVWNNFNEKTIIEKEKEKKDKDKEEDNKNNINNLSSSQILKDSNDLLNKDENENKNKTKYQKLLGKIDEEEENEEGEGKKLLGFIKKINRFKNRVSLFWTDNIFTRIKKWG